MDDFFLEGVAGENRYFVTPLSNSMYREGVGHTNGLGGPHGYFICTSISSQPEAGFKILAKATTFEAAHSIFNALINQHST